MIIGLTGRNAAGKGTVADWLVAQGFHYTSLSDAIRAWLRQQGLEPTRDQLTWAGRTLRAEGGPGVLAARTLAALPDGRDVVVDSIRNPAEVAVLRARPDFLLVEVFADEHVRYERLRARARAGDAQSFEEFVRQEQAELTSSDSAGQQLIATAALADLRLDNGGDPAHLEAELARLLQGWRRRSGTP
jgi:dephospho-CoA kinase